MPSTLFQPPQVKQRGIPEEKKVLKSRYQVMHRIKSHNTIAFNEHLMRLRNFAYKALYPEIRGFADSTCGKEPVCNARDLRDACLIPGSGRSPGEGNGNPLP